MKKKLIGIVFAVALVLSIGAAAYAAAGGFTMTYLPGTNDNVTDLPAADSGMNGQSYTVSSTVPRREGYEFLGWTLDYGAPDLVTLNYQVAGDPTYGKPADVSEPSPVTDIRAGSSVTLADALTAAPRQPDSGSERYIVKYLDYSTNEVLATEKVVYDSPIGARVTEQAKQISDYELKYPSGGSASITILPTTEYHWTFTGWCSDEACTVPVTEIANIGADTTVYGRWNCEPVNLPENEIVFFYEYRPRVEYFDYTVRYIDENGTQLLDDVIRTNIESGAPITESAKEIPGYAPLETELTFVITQPNRMIVFVYRFIEEEEDIF